MGISTSAVPLSTARRCYRFCYYRWRPRRCFWSCRRRSAFRSAGSTWCPWAGWSWCPLGWRSRRSCWPRWRTRRLKRCTSVFLAPEAIDKTELSTCVKVEVAVPGSPSLISPVVSADVKEHWNKSTRRACGNVLRRVVSRVHECVVNRCCWQGWRHECVVSRCCWQGWRHKYIVSHCCWQRWRHECVVSHCCWQGWRHECVVNRCCWQGWRRECVVNLLLLTGMTSPLPDEKCFSYEWVNHWKGTTQFAYRNVLIKKRSVLPPLIVLIPPFSPQVESGVSSVVRAPGSWLKVRGFESLQEQRENLLLQGQLSVQTLIWYSFHPRVTAVARKRSRPFCQKCRWQDTAKHACTLRMWLCMKWHGAWLYRVRRTRGDGSSFMWHQPCQRCKYTASVDI